jgi:hypothetical protein
MSDHDANSLPVRKKPCPDPIAEAGPSPLETPVECDSSVLQAWCCITAVRRPGRCSQGLYTNCLVKSSKNIVHIEAPIAHIAHFEYCNMQ